MQFEQLKIGFVGTGKMATALAQGFVTSGLPAARVCGTDPVAASRDAFLQAVEEADVSNNVSVLQSADVVFLAVKPQVLQSVAESIAAQLTGKLVVSIAAGVCLEKLESWLPKTCRVIRVMPNTPCLVGQGACGVSRGAAATNEDEEIVCQLLQTVGIVERVPESLLDAVTGVSGSGPAYVFQMIEALSDGGVKAGLPRATATRLAAQTLLGAAKMVLETDQHPAALKDAVTSPGGTTIAALHTMEQGGVRAALMSAVETAVRKSKELA